MASRVKGQPYENMVRDPCPPGGYPPVEQRRNPDSVFNESLWPKSSISVTSTILKGQAKEQFKLTNEDMCDLYHQRTEGPAKDTNRIVIWKVYFKCQCERRAWEVHGGPKGLAYALRSRNYDRLQRASASSSNVQSSQQMSGSVRTSPQKSNATPVRPKARRLEPSMQSTDDDGEDSVKSEDESSWGLIPMSTPHQRKKLAPASASIPKKRGNVNDEDLEPATPQKKVKQSPKGATNNDDKASFQLPTPTSMAKKPTYEDVFYVQDSDEDFPESPLPIKRSKSSKPDPSTPLKKEDDLSPFPTPSSSQKNRPSEAGTQPKKRRFRNS